MSQQTEADDLAYEGVEDDPHELPLRVVDHTDTPSAHAVGVYEVFDDGSESSTHYTEEQARALRDALDDVLNDEGDDTDADADDSTPYAVVADVETNRLSSGEYRISGDVRTVAPDYVTAQQRATGIHDDVEVYTINELAEDGTRQDALDKAGDSA